ncbi:hypothetical protein AQJ30_23735 [Streptomyces longwoodensis]|uniref:Uncharacterized protein n=1 Tax=Streptomyces longwoodensis TaxID=68231 RepID=A0A124HQK8_9ACTN|nr:hypothetical protein AQJ30_23735 [Streptomyces longwoodensis]
MLLPVGVAEMQVSGWQCAVWPTGCGVCPCRLAEMHLAMSDQCLLLGSKQAGQCCRLPKSAQQILLVDQKDRCLTLSADFLYEGSGEARDADEHTYYGGTGPAQAVA